VSAFSLELFQRATTLPETLAFSCMFGGCVGSR
jgi:hypothetical protein